MTFLTFSGARAAGFLQRSCAKRGLPSSGRFWRGRSSRTTNDSLSFLSSFAVDVHELLRNEGSERYGQKSAYERAMPRTFPTKQCLALPAHTRPFSTTGAERESYRQRVVERASQHGQRVMERASNFRDNARESYKEFKEHPRESMQSGAKSFSEMMRKYGPVFLGTYFVVYVTTLGTLFGCVESGIMDPVYLFSLFGDVNPEEAKSTAELVVEWMNNHSFTEKYAPYVERNPSMANLAIAWIAVKFTEPIRAPLALGLTPRVARLLGYNKTATTDDETVGQSEREKPERERSESDGAAVQESAGATDSTSFTAKEKA